MTAKRRADDSQDYSNRKRSPSFAKRYRLGSQIFEFIPKKQLGQNFLVDKNIMDKMVAACDFNSDDELLEIGPGLGVLTFRMAPLVGQMTAVETDPRLFATLMQENHFPNLQIIHADFLKFDLSGLKKKMKAVGNLPYYITTPIIEKILKHREHFSSVFLTLQLELGERLIASPGSKDYSAFTLFVQYFSQVQMLFKIKNTSFKPAPKVNSCFLKFTLREKPQFPTENEDFLFVLIRMAFQHRRKTLPTALQGLEKKDRIIAGLKELALDEKIRPDQMSLENFVRLSNLLNPDEKT